MVPEALDWAILRRLDGLIAGDHVGRQLGDGLDVADLREYQSHDDIRRIDWNVTARTTVPHVKDYFEEREVTAWFIVDTSASMPGVATTEAVLTITQALARGQHRIGLVLSDGRDQPGEPLGRAATIVRPGSGREHLLRISEALSAAFAAEPASTQQGQRWRRKRKTRKANVDPAAETDLASVISLVQPHLTRRSLVFIVSDFLAADAWSEPAREIGIRHEVIALRTIDPTEYDLTNGGLVVMQDAETGEQVRVNADDARFQARLAQEVVRRDAAVAEAASRAAVDLYSLDTSANVVDSLVDIARDRSLRMATQRGAHR